MFSSQDPDQYWIGKALAHHKTHTEAGGGRVRFAPGDVEFAVEWYQRDISGGDQRRIFKQWARDEEAGDEGPKKDQICMLLCSRLSAPPKRFAIC